MPLALLKFGKPFTRSRVQFCDSRMLMSSRKVEAKSNAVGGMSVRPSVSDTLANDESIKIVFAVFAQSQVAAVVKSLSLFGNGGNNSRDEVPTAASNAVKRCLIDILECRPAKRSLK
ncbi:hypothetical protein PoMZ_03210 [Pyricularia oryzae]|uniref:Uncharacterized protein n=1 Tax=Pyricularia oryzae TaxID=318829 RepID=A0A4V1C611_PYROR|nr:hypothetical protein PoMZ_03210 [Pyricularia oryzae]